MLVEHRVHDVDKGLIAGKEAVPSGEEIPFEPPLAGMLAQDLHHPAIRGQVFILLQLLRDPSARCDVKQCRQSVRGRLVRAKHAKVGEVVPHDVTQQATQHARGLRFRPTRRIDVDCVAAIVRHAQLFQQLPTVCMRVRAHASLAHRCPIRDHRIGRPRCVKQLIGPIALEPRLELRQMLRIVCKLRQRYLV